MAQDNPKLVEAHALIRQGESARARLILVAVLREEPNNAVAWFLLSHALQDVERQQYALVQALLSNPDFEHARQRLQKVRSVVAANVGKTAAATAAAAALDEAADPVEILMGADESPATPVDELRASVSPFIELPQEPESEAEARPRWPRVLLSIFLLGLLAAALIFGWQYAAGADLFGPGASSTPVASRTLAPTWTPTPQGTPQASIATEAPAVQPQFETLPEMEVIAGQLAALRGQEVAAAPASLLSAEDFAAWRSSQPSAAWLEDAEHLLRALGMLGPAESLQEYELNHRLDPLGGFYSPSHRQVYLAARRFDAPAQFAYARLLALGMALERVEGAAGCEPLQDACRALWALAVGEAALLAEQWAQANEIQPPPGALPFIESDQTAEFVREELAFPWNQGRDFVGAAYDEGGWAAVDALHVEPPRSSEQLLHAEKYTGEDAPLALADADVGGVLGSSWQPIGQGGLGEWLTYRLLAQGSPRTAAAAAAAGWGGDHYQGYRRASDGAVALAVHWRMDTEEDATELSDALQQLLAARFASASPLGGGQCWAGDGKRACLFAVTDGVLWLQGPDEIVVLQVMLAQYPDFQ